MLAMQCRFIPRPLPPYHLQHRRKGCSMAIYHRSDVVVTLVQEVSKPPCETALPRVDGTPWLCKVNAVQRGFSCYIYGGCA